MNGNVVSLDSEKYPFVSIAIITFNSEKTIEKCLSSVFDVDYPKDRYEVIVVDAGSTDRTREIIKKFPLEKFIIKEGALRGEARDICVHEAKGEIIAMIDSDVFSLDNDWLTKAVREFDDPHVALVRGSDRLPFPGEVISFVQKVLYLWSHPSRVLLKEENWNGA